MDVIMRRARLYIPRFHISRTAFGVGSGAGLGLVEIQQTNCTILSPNNGTKGEFHRRSP